MSESEGFTIDGRENIRVATLLALASGLALEINSPGMKLSSRGSALDAAKIQRIIPRDKRGNRKDALAKTVAEIQQLWPAYVPSRLVQKALGS